MADDVKDAASSTAVADTDADSASSTEKTDAEGAESSAAEKEDEGLKPKTAERIQTLLSERAKAEEAAAYWQEKAEALEAERKKGEPKSDEQVKAEALKREAREKLLEIFPELREITEAREAAKKELEEEKAARDEEAMTETVSLMKQSGLAVSEDQTERMSKMLVGIISQQPSLLREFRRGSPSKAVRGAFDLAQEQFGKLGERKANAQTQRDKEKLRALPKTHTSGGSPGEGHKAPEPVKDVRDADRRVREILAKAGKE